MWVTERNLKIATLLGMVGSHRWREVNAVCGGLGGSTEVHLLVTRFLKCLCVDSGEHQKGGYVVGRKESKHSLHRLRETTKRVPGAHSFLDLTFCLEIP